MNLKPEFDLPLFVWLFFFLWTIQIARMQETNISKSKLDSSSTMSTTTKKPVETAVTKALRDGDDEEEIEITATILLGVEDLTDVPNWEIYEMLNHDLGTYTPMDFAYYNFQHYNPADKEFYHEQSDLCYEDYFRCISTQVHSKYVCTLNDLEIYPEGKRYFNTLCEMFLDNCLRGMRYWYVVDYGICRQYGKKEEKFYVEVTRRQMLSSLWKHITGRALNFIKRQLPIKDEVEVRRSLGPLGLNSGSRRVNKDVADRLVYAKDVEDRLVYAKDVEDRLVYAKDVATRLVDAKRYKNDAIQRGEATRVLGVHPLARFRNSFIGLV